MGNRGPHTTVEVAKDDPKEKMVKGTCTCGKRLACTWCSDEWGWWCCNMGNKDECSGNPNRSIFADININVKI